MDVVNCFQILYLYLLKQCIVKVVVVVDGCELLSDFVSLPPETVLKPKSKIHVLL